MDHKSSDLHDNLSSDVEGLITSSISKDNILGAGEVSFVFRFSNPIFKKYVLKINKNNLEIVRDKDRKIISISPKYSLAPDKDKLMLSTPPYIFSGDHISQPLLELQHLKYRDDAPAPLTIMPFLDAEKLDTMEDRLRDEFNEHIECDGYRAKSHMMHLIMEKDGSLNRFFSAVARLGSQEQYFTDFIYFRNRTELDFMGDNILLSKDGDLRVIDQTNHSMPYPSTRTVEEEQVRAQQAIDVASDNLLLFFARLEKETVWRKHDAPPAEEYLKTLEKFKHCIEIEKSMVMNSYSPQETAKAKLPLGFTKVNSVSCALCEPTHVLKTQLDRLYADHVAMKC